MKTSELIFLLPMNMYLYLPNENRDVRFGEWNFRLPLCSQWAKVTFNDFFFPFVS